MTAEPRATGCAGSSCTASAATPCSRLWKSRWNLLRLTLAAFILWIAVTDTGARLARRQLALLPDFDYAAEVVRLRTEGRFGEAIVIADAGLGAPIDKATRDRLTAERAATEAEQASLLRRAKDLARGAITGGATIGTSNHPPDASLEMLIGAIAADMLVIGDIRDLLIQGYKYAAGNETDAVIIALSTIGLVTTLAPEIDWAPSILKAARRVGAMSDKLGDWLVTSLRAGRAREVETLLTDTAAIARTSSPAGAVRLLKSVDSPEDAARIARFLTREGKPAAAALHITAEAGTIALRQAEALRSAGKLDEAAHLESLILKSAAKGERGASLLKSGALRPLLKPHPLLGALKSLWKGNLTALIQRALERFDPIGWWAIPALCAWTILEGLLLLRKCTSRPQV